MWILLLWAVVHGESVAGKSVGLHLGKLVDKTKLQCFKREGFFVRAKVQEVPPHHLGRRKSSQPLFLVAPGPEGLARVAVERWPLAFVRAVGAVVVGSETPAMGGAEASA